MAIRTSQGQFRTASSADQHRSQQQRSFEPAVDAGGAPEQPDDPESENEDRQRERPEPRWAPLCEISPERRVERSSRIVGRKAREIGRGEHAHDRATDQQQRATRPMFPGLSESTQNDEPGCQEH